MQAIINRPTAARLTRLSLRSWFKRRGRERQAPRSQAEIDRLSQGWERHSESTRAKMARIGI